MRAKPSLGPGKYFNGQFGAIAEQLLDDEVTREFIDTSIIGQYVKEKLKHDEEEKS